MRTSSRGSCTSTVRLVQDADALVFMLIRLLYYLIAKGYKSTTIVKLLREEGLDVEVSAVCRLLKKYKDTGSIARRPGLLSMLFPSNLSKLPYLVE